MTRSDRCAGRIVALAAVVAGCGASPLTGHVKVQPEAAANYATIVVELEAGTVAGSSDVLVGFDDTDVACRDGTDVDLADVQVGTPITFWPVDDNYDTSDPPGLRAKQVRIDCGSGS